MRTKPREPTGRVRIDGGGSPEKTREELPLDEPEDEDPEEEELEVAPPEELEEELEEELLEEELLDEDERPPEEPEDELEEPDEPDDRPEEEPPEEELLDEEPLDEDEELPDEPEPPWSLVPLQAPSINADAAPMAARRVFNRIAAYSPIGESSRSPCGNCPVAVAPPVGWQP